MNTRTQILNTIESTEASHKKAINDLRRQAYEAWVAEGGKGKFDKEQYDAKIVNKKQRYLTKNGLTIHKLRQAGVTVTVSHIRYVDAGIEPLVPVPSSLRGVYNFHPRGGATHIIMVAPDGTTIGVSSVCHVDDSFDYKMGVKIALDQVTQDEAEHLLSGLEALETVTEKREEKQCCQAEHACACG